MKNIAVKEIDDKAQLFCEVNDKVWGYAELSLLEFQSAELYCKVLKENGFAVTENIGGMETCFKGSFGTGKPCIGILGEFDALTGLSQVGSCCIKEEVVKDGNGHGCGHNMLGAGSLAAAFGIKKYLEETGKEGTVIFYGCPGEEGVGSKSYMARDNLWNELDIALTWHPGTENQVSTGTSLSCIQNEYTFKGIASHAAGSPENGRSALDAVEMMNIGVQFLREHMPSSARIHYAITNAGGNSPNVVQPMAKVLYMVRDIQVGDAIALQKRVDAIAQGAAIMTETTVSAKFVDGLANVIPNKTIESLLHKNLGEIDVPKYTEEEMAFAQKICNSYEIPTKGLPGGIENDNEEIYNFVKEASLNGKKPLNDFVIPYTFSSNKVSSGSTDVGDVSWQVPTAQVNVVGFVAGAPGHSWQNVASGNMSIGHKGLICAGKVLAATAIDLFENPDIIVKAKQELKERTQCGYQCPIPMDAVAEAIG